ncbi:hypothetical protein ATANTOWER_031694 [Ataeniobius toweri]|uniref:Tetraspanin n=1 Tax=Ataeniobius toweri TaxID=208326 RepID=A0ABU7C171_9TELE|nr:hypothetical protein [Ataeniobius toweri]
MCNNILKIMMFIFNGVIFLAGVAILGVGVWVTVDSDSLLGLLDDVENLPDEVFRLASVGYVMIGVGAALLLIGFLGCCGAIMENRCMLLTFFSVVLIIFLIEVAGAVVLFVFDDVAEDIFDNLEDEVRKTIQSKYGADEKMTSLWNATMERFECCGYKNYTDFDDSPFNRPEDNYPSPCCSGTGSMVVCSSHNAALSV